MAALSRFISKLAERALPFFKLLCKTGPFVYTPEAEQAFQEFKRYLTLTLVLVAPEPSEPLLIYISDTREVVSVVLIAERAGPQGEEGVPELEDAEGVLRGFSGALPNSNEERDPRAPGTSDLDEEHNEPPDPPGRV